MADPVLICMRTVWDDHNMVSAIWSFCAPWEWVVCEQVCRRFRRWLGAADDGALLAYESERSCSGAGRGTALLGLYLSHNMQEARPVMRREWRAQWTAAALQYGLQLPPPKVLLLDTLRKLVLSASSGGHTYSLSFVQALIQETPEAVVGACTARFVRISVRHHIGLFVCRLCRVYSVQGEPYQERQETLPCAAFWNKRRVCVRCSRRSEWEVVARAHLSDFLLTYARVRRALREGDLTAEVGYTASNGKQTTLYRGQELRALAAKVYGGAQRFTQLRTRIRALDQAALLESESGRKVNRKRRRQAIQKAKQQHGAKKRKSEPESDSESIQEQQAESC